MGVGGTVGHSGQKLAKTEQYFSGKYHAKFGHVITYIFEQKCFVPSGPQG